MPPYTGDSRQGGAVHCGPPLRAGANRYPDGSRTNGMAEQSRAVEITDWDAVNAELERFCTDGTFHAESNVASCTVGNGTIEIHANGRIESSTPRHEFDGEIDTIEFDHRTGAITAESEELSYTFRRP